MLSGVPRGKHGAISLRGLTVETSIDPARRDIKPQRHLSQWEVGSLAIRVRGKR